MANKETILDIAKSIDYRTKDERSNGFKNRAIARCLVETSSTIKPTTTEEVFFLTNYEDIRGRFVKDFSGSGGQWQSVSHNTSTKEGRSIYKNTKMGEMLSKYWSGKHSYEVKTITKKVNEVSADILNKSTYDNFGPEVKDLEIRLAGDKEIYRYARLNDLLNNNIEAQKRLEEERERMRLLQEEMEKQRIAKEQAEAERIRIEQERIETERLKSQAEIDRLEKSIEDTNKKIISIKNFLRTGVQLRSQHILDEFQENAKRSHLFDGTAIVIEGGPGTGKTTTTIQRLKFLLSESALIEYDNPLTEKQIEYLTDRREWNSRWLFFSPTDLLLKYLRDNMAQEELIADDKNTRTLERFRKIKMREYGLFDPSKDGPFKDYKASANEDTLITNPKSAIKEFEQFCIDFIQDAMNKRVALKTSDYKWHNLALGIKATYKAIKVNDLDDLMRLLNALCDRDKTNIKSVDNELKKTLKNESYKIQKAIMAHEVSVKAINELFELWKRENMQVVDEDENDVTTDEEDEENEELESFNKQDFEAQLFSTLKKLLRKLGLKQFDSKTKISRREDAFLQLIEPYITNEIDLKSIGELALFSKNFATMCRGLDSVLILQIPKIYKAFRKKLLTDKNGIYDLKLLETIIKKDNNKHLHPEEQDFLLGFLNNMFYRIFKKSKDRFNELKNKYVAAYRDSVRPVIGIDEATDFSILDYYCMVSFRHYDFSSITLCGDIMQGLNHKGIDKWETLREFVLPSLEIMPLNISYRQLPTLVDISKEMYKDDQGIYPSFNSERDKSENEPQPLLLISDDEDEKAKWISKRIIEIYRNYDESLPSVAIFVGEEVDIHEFIQRIEDLDMLNGIEVVDCTGGNLDSKEVVRVFRLSQVKGMEFEAVFFYDIDKAIENKSSKIMRRHLYVGVSRATSHLAATMSTAEGNESIVKYFNQNSGGWS